MNQGQNGYSPEIIELIKGMARVEQKLDDLGNVKETAIEAKQSATSAHLRINKLDKVVFWAGSTIIGGLILGAIGVLFYFAKGGGA